MTSGFYSELAATMTSVSATLEMDTGGDNSASLSRIISTLHRVTGIAIPAVAQSPPLDVMFCSVVGTQNYKCWILEEPVRVHRRMTQEDPLGML